MRLASPAHWMPKISAQRPMKLRAFSGYEGSARNLALEAFHCFGERECDPPKRFCELAEKPSKLVMARRSVTSLATSTSWVIMYESRRTGPPSPTRGDSARRRPFSAIRQWPPKTTSVVDSDGPAPAMHRLRSPRPDWPTTRSVR